jgi:queuine tRNA-ribosyltransferase
MPQTQKPIFEVIRECPQTRARAGLLHTAHGAIETPVFMPVGTQATVKALTPKMLAEELGARLILGNTYHLYLRPGHATVAGLGGLHRFMSWPGAILTDSGGFQVFSLSSLRKISEEGVVFRSHLDGSQHLFTPESTVDIQLALGSDVLMTLDDCTPYPVSHEAARASMEMTVRWAQRAVSHWQSRLAEGLGDSGPAPANDPCSAAAGPGAGPAPAAARPAAQLFPIVQGSMYADLRRDCARRLLDLDAPGYAIGGLSVGEPRPLSYEMMEAVEELLPRQRPRYMMGVGMLHELGEYVARGVDMMDCVLPTRNARNGYLFTSSGRIVIKNQAWARDPRPVDEQCGCYTCRNFSRAYLRHLFLAREMLYSTLATLHNLAVYLDRMRRIREAILVGDLAGFLARVRASHEADDQPD